METDDLLENLEVQSVSEFENFINEKSGFVNAMMSATAYGKDVEYKRLLELEKLIDSRLTSADLDGSKELKSSVIAEITEKAYRILFRCRNESEKGIGKGNERF